MPPSFLSGLIPPLPFPPSLLFFLHAGRPRPYRGQLRHDEVLFALFFSDIVARCSSLLFFPERKK